MEFKRNTILSVFCKLTLMNKLISIKLKCEQI